MEGELARTIESLGPIANASVHIAIPKETVFAQKQSAPTASIVLNVRSGMNLSLKQILGIKNLVSASIAQLTPENVSIVNQDGEPLGDEQNNLFQGELVKSQVRYKTEFANIFEQKKALLTATWHKPFSYSSIQSNHAPLGPYMGNGDVGVVAFTSDNSQTLKISKV